MGSSYQNKRFRKTPAAGFTPDGEVCATLFPSRTIK